MTSQISKTELKSNSLLDNQDLKKYKTVELKNVALFMDVNFILLNVRNILLFLMIGSSKTFFCLLNILIQYCDQRHLNIATKYVVKKSLDSYFIKRFKKNQKMTQQKMKFVAMMLFIMITKAIQDPCIYDQNSIQQIIYAWGLSQCNVIDCIRFQISYLSNNEFKFDITTPYDFLQVFNKAFQFTSKELELIQNLISFCLVQLQLIFNSAEEIFYGSMLAFASLKKIPQQLIIEHTIFKKEAKQVCEIILNLYNHEIEQEKLQQAQKAAKSQMISQQKQE